MTIEQELRLSYYKQVADIDAEHSIFLVQDVRTKEFYVKKLLRVYNADIFRYLQAHPVANTPKILLVEEDNGILTVIEEYIPGETLATRLEKVGTLSEEETTGIAIQLCKILKSFHSCTPAIVNRDVKPENIKVTPDGIVKLVDLNAAKWSDPEADRDTVLLGTQGYAAPEQYGFGASGIQTDIYAVGVAINVMRTGQLPSQAITEGPLGKVVKKCVELSPSRRFQSADQLLAILEGEPGNPLDPRRFYPPGFRRKNTVQWFFAAWLYLFLLPIIFVDITNSPNPLIRGICKVSVLLLATAIILFNGNYLNVQRHFFLTRSHNRFLRWLGIAVIDVLILCLWVAVADLFFL